MGRMQKHTTNRKIYCSVANQITVQRLDFLRILFETVTFVAARKYTILFMFRTSDTRPQNAC